MDEKQVICIDLDGTICQYDGWKGEDHFGDVIPGAKEALQKLKKAQWLVIIFTTRGDKHKIKKYLDDNGLFYDYINENPHQPKGASGKLFAHVYLDDRAVRFSGDWEESIKEIETFEPWTK